MKPEKKPVEHALNERCKETRDKGLGKIYAYSFIPRKAFFSLKEVCELKGLNYRTACNKPYLQPNGGKADGKIGGKKAFSRQTVIKWIFMTDEEIISSTNKDRCA